MDASPSYTVLRIKRKATEAPLSSLVIHDGAAPAKKRREINPLGRSRGVFRLAETVPDTWVGEGEEGAVLRERIKGLLSAKSRAEKTELPPSPQPLLAASASIATSSSSPHPQPRPPPTLTEREEPSIPGGGDAAQPEPNPSTTGPRTPPFQDSEARRQSSASGQKQVQYRVVQPPPPRPSFGLPPRVMTNAEEARLAAEKQFNFVDAEAISSAAPSRKPSLPTAQEQKEMAPFLSMLEDVLKLESPAPSPPPHVVEEDGETYVYDLYYKDNRPEHSGPVALGVGDGVHIGALLGYGEDDDDDTVSLSELEDEADEDSNDEDYYRNDYPEDEDADEDMEGFKDAFDDEDDEEYARSDDDEERGLWDYR